MKEGQKLWTREELILTINLYCKLPFGKLHRGNPQVIRLASLLNRTPNAVAYKLVNFASFDPSLQARGIKGASNTSKLDREVWDEFYLRWEDAAFESEQLLAARRNVPVEQVSEINEEELLSQGKERETLIKVRVNQSFFRKTVLASYNYTCCITGINTTELLVAGHIRPWSIDGVNRLNPRNGLALNNLHDRAFESGLLTITPEYRIKISSELKQQKKNPAVKDYFLRYDGGMIILPTKFLPDPEFLIYHNNERFKE